jgi:hypothetical protein
MAKTASVDEGQQLRILAPDERQILVTITGTSSLLTNRMDEEARAKLTETAPTRQKGPRIFRDPEDVWRAHLHVIDADAQRYGIPGSALHGAMIKAGRFCVGVAMTELRGVFRVPFGLLEIQGSAPHRHDAIGRPQRTGPPMPIYRPEFPLPWWIEVPVTYDNTQISQEGLVNLVQRAGYSIGIGAYRPESEGCHGTFRVTEVKEVRREA